jgi:hypothetical protein
VLTATPRGLLVWKVLQVWLRFLWRIRNYVFPEPTRGCRLAWSRLVDLGSIDPGSNPGSPTIEQKSLCLYSLYDGYFSIFASGKLQDIFVRFGVAVFDFDFIANHNLFNLFIPER